ncbi:MAG: hypothetical protein ACI8UP_005046 [Porticoccaceae bacterium]|jgi:hypothetical protein
MNVSIAFLLLFTVAFCCTTPLFSEDTVVSTEINLSFSFRLPDKSNQREQLEFLCRYITRPAKSGGGVMIPTHSVCEDQGLVPVYHILIKSTPGQQEKQRTGSVQGSHNDHRRLQTL